MEGYGGEKRNRGYEVYGNSYLMEERMRGRHGELGREVREGHQNQDLGINSIKVSLPIFKGESDTEAYISWEYSCDKIFQLNDLTEENKSCYAIAHFKGYANTW